VGTVKFLGLIAFIVLFTQGSLEASAGLVCAEVKDWKTFNGYSIEDPQHTDEEIKVREVLRLEVLKNEELEPPFNYSLRVSNYTDFAQRYPDRELSKLGVSLELLLEKMATGRRDLILGKAMECASKGFVFYCKGKLEDWNEEDSPVHIFQTRVVTFEDVDPSYAWDDPKPEFETLQRRFLEPSLSSFIPNATLVWDRKFDRIRIENCEVIDE
jgi:hypothetical protein